MGGRGTREKFRTVSPENLAPPLFVLVMLLHKTFLFIFFSSKKDSVQFYKALYAKSLTLPKPSASVAEICRHQSEICDNITQLRRSSQLTALNESGTGSKT
jgi:hypothetical protein